MSERKFELGDILSIITERLVSRRGMDGIYEILDFMTVEGLFTHELPGAANVCKSALLVHHPQLANVHFPDKFQGQAHVDRWLAEQEATYGNTLAVKSLAAVRSCETT